MLVNRYKIDLRRILSVLLISSLILQECLPAATAAEFSIFKKTYIRNTGKPVTETDSFTALNQNKPYAIRITNGLPDTSNRVSSAVGILNNSQFLSPNQLNQNVGRIETPITLLSSNQISMQLRSKPQSQLTVEIIGNDDQPPVLTWLAPENNALFESQPVPSELKLSDDNSGIDPLSLKILLDNVSVRGSFPGLSAPILDATLDANLNATHGHHTLTAQVKDIAGNQAQPAVVSFLVNRKPIANAGVDQDSFINTMVTLDGSQSLDPDNDPLTYKWSLLLRPQGSSATLSDTSVVSPTFIPDKKGVYELQLIVNDGFADSAADSVVVTIKNRSPVANAGADQNVFVGDTVILDGNGSSDPDGDPLTYQWMLISKPNSSNAVLSGATTASPSFIPDIEGRYEIQLIVNDGEIDSVPDSIVITATNPGPPTPKPTAQSGFIHGYVFDSRTELPLKDVMVIIEGIEGIILTNAEGKFSFPTPGTGEFGLTFKKEGYVFAQRKAEVVSTRDSSVEPVYLTPADPKVTTITNEGGTHINSTGKVEITIPPNSLPAGTDKIDVQATLYEHSTELPAPLPETSFYTYALDIKPDGINFTQPVSGKLANELGFAPGTKIPIGFYNSQTLKWEDTGLMSVVSADGKWVEFEVTHFSPWDCNLPPRPPPTNGSPLVIKNNTKDNEDPTKNCAKDRSNSLVMFKSGQLFLDHSLPSIRTLNEDYILTFMYNSCTANPVGLISIDTNLNPSYTTVPLTSTFKLNIEGMNVQQLFKGASGQARYSYLYDCKNAQGQKLLSGSYPYTIGVSNDYTNVTYGTANFFGGPPTGDTGILTREPFSMTATVKGRIAVNNSQDSAFGSGWNLTELQRLYFDPDGSILLTEGDGSAKTFKFKPRTNQTKQIQNLAAASVNGWWGNFLSILLGNGDGTFQPRVTYPLQGDHGSYSLAVGDFNGDGFQDIVALNYLDRFVYILLGNGDGTFKPPVSYSVINNTFEIAVGDFNGDGFDDIAALNGNWPNEYISIFLSNGDGTFKPPVSYSVIYGISEIAVGDFNGDGFQDIAALNFNNPNGYISILLGNGDGTFKPLVSSPAGGSRYPLAVGDFNGDGLQDIASANNIGGSVSILLSNGDGTFKLPVSYPAGTKGVYSPLAIGDFNEDGFQDIAAINFNYPNNASVSILLGNGDGTFKPPVSYPAGTLFSYSLAVGDFNGDGFQDIAVANYTGGSVSILLGNGDGTFKPPVSYPAGAANMSSVVVFEPLDYKVYPKGAFIPPQGEYSYILQNPDKTYTRFLKDGTKAIFNEQGLHTQTIDKNGNTVNYDYADFEGDGKKDELSTITLSTGAKYQFYYDSRGKLSSITDPAGRSTKFTIDAQGNLTQIINPDNTTKNYAYDTNHLVTTKTDERGFITEYLYDERGAIKEVRSPEREITDVDINGAVTTTRKKETRLYYPSNAQGNIIPTGIRLKDQTPIDAYRPLDIKEGFVDGKGNKWLYRTNKFGGRLWFMDPLSNATFYERDVNSNLTKLARANGSVVDMTYGFKGNLMSVKENYNSAVTKFAYERNFNQPTSIKDPNGNTTKIDYDLRGNPVQITDAQGNITKMVYSPRGQVTKIIQAFGTSIQNETNFTYDPATFNLLSITDPLNHPRTFTYDAAGNVKTITDAEGKTITFEYDSMNRLMTVIDADNKTTKYNYYAEGSLKSVTDANNHTTSFEYNEQNLLTKVTNPLNQAKQFSYDVNRNLSFIITPNGDNIKFYYNKANILEKKFLPSETANYAYDALYNLTDASDSDSSLKFNYDPIGRLAQAITNQGFLQPQTSVSYAYDLNDNRINMTDPRGIITKYIYDSLNRLTDIKDAQNNTISHFEHDQLGRRISKSIPITQNLQLTTNYTYDLANRLLSISHLPSAISYSYIYDDVGNRKTQTDTYGFHNYLYDNLYRLTQAVHPNIPQEQYAYDPVGNRNPSSFNYDFANRLLDDGAYTYSYDNNGNMIKKINKIDGTTTDYNYDAENCLISVDYGLSTADYSYDPLGRRIQKNVNGVITKYLYDGKDIILEYDGSNNLIASYIHGPGIDEPIKGLSSQGTVPEWYYHTDALGSVTAITDSTGAVVQSYTYDSFGNIVNQTGSLTQPYTYTGREYDPETGLYFYRARYYDPKIGRFLQEDPIGFRGGDVNFYAYVENNPLNWIDPYGESIAQIAQVIILSGILAIQGVKIAAPIIGKRIPNVRPPQVQKIPLPDKPVVPQTAPGLRPPPIDPLPKIPARPVAGELAGALALAGIGIATIYAAYEYTQLLCDIANMDDSIAAAEAAEQRDLARRLQEMKHRKSRP